MSLVSDLFANGSTPRTSRRARARHNKHGFPKPPSGSFQQAQDEVLATV